MQNALTYENGASKRHAGLVAEKGTQYINELEKKIDDYAEKLVRFEFKCVRPGSDNEKLSEEITLLNDSMLQHCAVFEGIFGFDKAFIKEKQKEFRMKTSPAFSKSYFMNHARTWPLNYQGDYKTLEGVYRNMPMSEGIGYYLDTYFLSTTLAVAVRERREKLRELLKSELDRRGKLRILDIACGSCREIFELTSAIKESGARITCVDFDQDALNFAAKRMSFSGLSAEQIEFRRYNALRMVNRERNVKEFGMQDVIYSVGFFDYLGDDVLVRLLGSLYDLLVPGGKLIASFKDCRKYSTQQYHWLVNWDGFYQRTEEHFKEIFDKSGIPSSVISPLRDASGVILFFVVTK